MSIQDESKVVAGHGLRSGLALAMMAAAMIGDPAPSRYYRDRTAEPRKKSTHKRKFKGSKAAKRASRKRD